ncbi:hypothetical protein F5887DRAFT_980182 [Amanita rubescens]|nr:hypothetical protein F5887DRAFT_980182 [Amanita rubescens]
MPLAYPQYRQLENWHPLMVPRRYTGRHRVHHRHMRRHREHQHHDIRLTKYTNASFFASRQSHASGASPVAPVGELEPSYDSSPIYRPNSRLPPNASPPLASISTPYELTPYYTPYYRSTPSGSPTLGPSETSSVSGPVVVPPGSSGPAVVPPRSLGPVVLVPPRPPRVLQSPDLSTIQEETPPFTETRVLSSAHEPHGSPIQIQRSARTWGDYNEPRIPPEVTDLPFNFVPNVSPGTPNWLRNPEHIVDDSDTESGYSTSGQINEPYVVVDLRSATTDITNANTATHDEEGSIVPFFMPDNSNMASGGGGGGVQALTSSSTTGIPVNLSTSAETLPLPRRLSRIPSSTNMTTQGPASSLQPPFPYVDLVPRSLYEEYNHFLSMGAARGV